MAITVRISGVDWKNPSKDEEEDVLMALCHFFEGTDSYLKSLFSDAMVGWFSGKVRDDFSADIMAELFHLAKQDRESGSREIILREEIKSGVKTCNTVIAEMERAKAEANEDLENKELTINSLKTQINNCEVALNEAHRKVRMLEDLKRVFKYLSE